MADPMMAMLAQSLGLDPQTVASDPQAALQQLAARGGNPMLGMMLGQLLLKQQQSAQALAEHEPVTIESSVEPTRGPNVDSRAPLSDYAPRDLRAIVRQQREALASADRMANFIATSFGCCPHCWGLNGLCNHCHGKGQPGFHEPDIETLSTWLGKAAARVGWQLVPATRH